jgi:hypothetical protein
MKDHDLAMMSADELWALYEKISPPPAISFRR